MNLCHPVVCAVQGDHGKDNRKRKCVIVPETSYVKRKRAQVSKSVLEQVVDDGSSELAAGQVEQKFGNVTKLLESESEKVAAPAVGVAIENIRERSGCPISSVGRSTSMPGPSKNVVAARGRKLLQRRSSGGSLSSLDGDNHDFCTVSSHEPCFLLVFTMIDNDITLISTFLDCIVFVCSMCRMRLVDLGRNSEGS